MIVIDILPVPNQQLSVMIGRILWEIRIVTAKTIMAADISRDGEVLVKGQRIVADHPIIPYKRLSGDGNFVVLTPGREIPWWEEFGGNHILVYMSPEEMTAPERVIPRPRRPLLDPLLTKSEVRSGVANLIESDGSTEYFDNEGNVITAFVELDYLADRLTALRGATFDPWLDGSVALDDRVTFSRPISTLYYESSQLREADPDVPVFERGMFRTWPAGQDLEPFGLVTTEQEGLITADGDPLYGIFWIIGEQDSAQIVSPALQTVFDPSQGVVYWEGELHIPDEPDDDVFVWSLLSDSGALLGVCVHEGTSELHLHSTILDDPDIGLISGYEPGQEYRIAVAWSGRVMMAFVNGQKAGEFEIEGLFGFSRFVIGSAQDESNTAAMHTRRMTIFEQIQSESELVRITQPGETVAHFATQDGGEPMPQVDWQWVPHRQLVWEGRALIWGGSSGS